ncbi:uncharacterized protein LOC119739255 [Patiria miniata]|uniref:TLC domain-containing protein n=1 Tax=Patiria miniata TaxID=46514 RepID=A0A914B3F8_PATMI|nr:uncharacterized protein LOC119739255 [Patiria miniata]
MDANLAVDLFWISATVNASTALFFAWRGLAGWATGRFAREAADGSWRRSLFVLQDEKPWCLARFSLILVQSFVLCFAAFALLLQGDVLQNPFLGLTTSGRTCFAINIGCYMYLLIQDALLQRHLPNYYITFMHHLVAAVVYLVFLEYRQNALSGTVGLFFAAAAPFFELSDLLKELHVEQHRSACGVSFFLSGLFALVFRLLLPTGFVVYSYVVDSPFTMDILVMSCYFLSLVFFGMLNLWFVYSAGNSLRAHYRSRSAWLYMRPLQLGKPHGLDVRQARSSNTAASFTQASFTAKRNDLNLLAPCSNTNLASNTLTAGNLTNSGKDYHKMDIAAFFNTLGTAPSSECQSPLNNTPGSIELQAGLNQAQDTPTSAAASESEATILSEV